MAAVHPDGPMVAGYDRKTGSRIRLSGFTRKYAKSAGGVS